MFPWREPHSRRKKWEEGWEPWDPLAPQNGQGWRKERRFPSAL